MRGWLGCTIAWLVLVCPQAWAQDDVAPQQVPDVALRVAYFVADGAPVHVRVGEGTVASALATGSVTGYRFVRASGDAEITILDASEGTEDDLGPASAPVMARTTEALESGAYYTLIVIERAEDGSTSDDSSAVAEASLDVHVILDRFDAFAGSGEAGIRLLNLLPGGTEWSAHGARVGLEQAATERSAQDETRLADEAGFADPGSWVYVPVGIYHIRFDAVSENDAVPAPVEAALHGGALYTAFVYPGSGEGGPQVAIRVDAVVRATVGPAPARPGSSR